MKTWNPKRKERKFGIMSSDDKPKYLAGTSVCVSVYHLSTCSSLVVSTSTGSVSLSETKQKEAGNHYSGTSGSKVTT